MYLTQYVQENLTSQPIHFNGYSGGVQRGWHETAILKRLQPGLVHNNTE